MKVSCDGFVRWRQTAARKKAEVKAHRQALAGEARCSCACLVGKGKVRCCSPSQGY